MRVGVAIPVRNAVAFVEETLRSVYDQSRAADRVVVVDNGSEDGTRNLLERLRGELGFELLTESAPGASSARDTGWRALGDCDLIALCDADDLWDRSKLEKQVALFERESSDDLVCVYCANRVIDRHGNEIGRSGMPRMAGWVRDLVAQGHPVLGSMSSAVIRRAALERVGGFDRSLMADEDLDLFIRLAAAGRFDFVPEHLAALRTHDAQTSRDLQRLLRSKGQIINKYRDLYGPSSSFIESIRVEHMRADLRQRRGFSRLLALAFYPLIFGRQARKATHGRARAVLFPGVVAYSCWLLGRALMFAANRLADRHPAIR